MNLTQLLSLEITEQCNRAYEHHACPAAHPGRWATVKSRVPSTDKQLAGVAIKALRMGFDGRIAFHYYCEPLCDWPRIQRVVKMIRDDRPDSKFLLWTNGDLFPADLSEFAGVFETIVVTNYAGRDLTPLSAVCGDVRELRHQLDYRLNPPVHEGREPPCVRPFLEMIIDYCGNVRTCCMDWRGQSSIGNIHETPFDVLWDKWVTLRSAVASLPMGKDAPPRCLRCGTRYQTLANYADNVFRRQKEAGL